MVAGVPVGKLYDKTVQKTSDNSISRSSVDQTAQRAGPPHEGSIIILIATDAPLDSRQLIRLSKRAALGLGRTGSMAHHGSGDFMLAFSTGVVIPHYPKERTVAITRVADTHLNPLIAATVEATEEAILNALTMATTVIGRDSRRAEAISLSRLQSLVSGQVP
jgi:D-aminopeptidase